MRGHLLALRSRFAEAHAFDQQSSEILLKSVAESAGLKARGPHSRDARGRDGSERQPGSMRSDGTAGPDARLRAARLCIVACQRVRSYTVCASSMRAHTADAPVQLERIHQNPQFLAISTRLYRGTPVARSGSTGKNEHKGVDVAKEDRGFASMDRDKQKEIASKGGKAAHQKGTAHEWTVKRRATRAARVGWPVIGVAGSRRRRHPVSWSVLRQATGRLPPPRWRAVSNWTMIARSDCGGAPTSAAASAAS